MYARVLSDGLEACSLRSQDNNSLDSFVNRFLIKLFKTNNFETVSLLIVARGITLTYYSTVLKEKTGAFARKYMYTLCGNIFVQLC